MFEHPSSSLATNSVTPALLGDSASRAFQSVEAWRSQLSFHAMVVLIAAAYFLAAGIGLLLAIPPGYASPVWPPAGVALAAWLLVGRAALPGTFIGAAAANIGVMGATPAVAVAIGAGNAAELLVAGLLIDRLIAGRRLFDSAGSVARFVAIAFAAGAVAASNGVLTLALAGQVPWAQFATHWLTWWLGDATGIIIIAPLLVCCSDRADGGKARPGGKMEYALFGALLLLCAAMARLDNRAMHDAVQTIAYLLIPLVTWAATRLDRRAVTVASFAISAIAVVDVLDGRAAPFVSLALNDSLLLMQLFVSMVAATGLTLAALSGEAERANQRAAAGEQQAAEARVVALARRLAQVRDEERRRLAVELHDGLAQHLTGLNVCVDVIRARATEASDRWLLERVEEASNLARRASQRIRDVMVSLSPSSASANAMPLSSILRRHAAAFESRTGILVTVDAPLAPVRVAQEVKEVLTRVCLEALNNVSKHADANVVRVELQTTAERILLTLEDDGKGFDPAHLSSGGTGAHLGLHIMEERTLSIAGQLRVLAAPGKGTRIEISVPKTGA